MLNKAILYCLENKIIPMFLLLIFVGAGLVTSPFGGEGQFLPSDPVPVDAIPDIGENQQIVFTQWMGRSPQDIEDQITYPLTSSLLGISGVKAIRSSSIFGTSSIYIIFEEGVEFYWSRSRILEKLNSLPAGLLPDGVTPSLGPDATALGQVFWYTLEGQDEDGNPTGGWDLAEIRSVQDFQVKYALNSVPGVSEVASIGGFVQEYQIDVDPDALRIYNIPLSKVMLAVKKSNKDIGAKTIEINKAEYLVRGLGYIKSIEDIELSVVTVADNVPIRIKDIAVVTLGPAIRRGLLDKGGAEVVGGVVVARYGSNPLAVIKELKTKIEKISSGLPSKTLSDGVESRLTIVPFYDRTTLIQETLGTLEEALALELLVTILVIIVMIANLRASFLIAAMLPIAVLMVFVAMKLVGVDANVVALSGIAIAIGTMVDLGIVLLENIVKHLKDAKPTDKLLDTIYQAAAEVSSAILTTVSTTLVSFVPIFMMEAAEGKLFRPLAFTKSFALLATLFVVFFILPTLANWVFAIQLKTKRSNRIFNGLLAVLGVIVSIYSNFELGLILMLLGGVSIGLSLQAGKEKYQKNAQLLVSIVAMVWLLARYWMPLGSLSIFSNFLFVGGLVGVILFGFYSLERYYEQILRWCLENKKIFMALPSLLIGLGLTIWFGFSTMFAPVQKGFESIGVPIQTQSLWSSALHAFPGIEDEFMPSLDEGAFLLMPTSMPHSGMEQNKDTLQQLDMMVSSTPEVELVVGKMGRAETALDPAPISMYENIINYKPEYIVDSKGHRERFKVNKNGDFILGSGDELANQAMLEKGISTKELILDSNGRYFRNWRDSIQSSDDIWDEIIKVVKIPGMTSAPKLQPIETRLIMLQTGMRAPMGIKVYGGDLESIEKFGQELEVLLKKLPSVKKEAVFADRIIGKPYLIFEINREAISRYGLTIEDVQRNIETAVGGIKLTTTVEGRKRFPVRIRYPREFRNDPEMLKKIFVGTPMGVQVPLDELLTINYQKGPQMIKSEDTFLVGYVLFDKKDGYSEVEVVEEAERFIQYQIEEKKLKVPSGISYKFSGTYENQQRAEKRLRLIIPLALAIILLLLYLQFKSISTSLMIFLGVAMSFSGAFLLLWFYGQDWFFNIDIGDVNIRDLFQIKTINLSVAVWVGFVALFGIATDDGVLMGTYLDQFFERNKPKNILEIRDSVVLAGQKRITPAIMTSATTIIALLPVLTSTGRGSDIMIPMAIPAFGGMLVASITYFIVPVLYSWREERRFLRETS